MACSPIDTKALNSIDEVTTAILKQNRKNAAQFGSSSQESNTSSSSSSSSDDSFAEMTQDEPVNKESRTDDLLYKNFILKPSSPSFLNWLQNVRQTKIIRWNS